MTIKIIEKKIKKNSLKFADIKIVRTFAIPNGNKVLSNKQNAGVLKLVDNPDLGSGASRRGGSSPFARTKRALILN